MQARKDMREIKDLDPVDVERDREQTREAAGVIQTHSCSSVHDARSA